MTSSSRAFLTWAAHPPLSYVQRCNANGKIFLWVPHVRNCLSGDLNQAQQPSSIALLAAFELLTALS
ncbi:hypothetical protein ACVWXO_009882 [Bradyrhizobium sp. LM2.7]